ncbi:MAG: hypothetical protein AAGD01_19495 [Acidobacteriota bacterium]
MSRLALLTFLALALLASGSLAASAEAPAANSQVEAPQGPVSESPTEAPVLETTASSCSQAGAESADLEVLRAEIFAAGLWPPFGGGDCNQTTCSAGQFCCNYSCSVCAPFGSACTDVYCPPAF